MIKQELIKEILKNNNFISIEKFTEICLYGKKGYYKNSDVIGKAGDFITSPEISQLFGEIVGLFIFSIWKKNINKPFDLIELGPGKGTLLIDMLNITKSFSDFSKSTYIYLIEKNNKLIKTQDKNLKKFNFNLKNIKWLKDINLKSKRPKIFIANEFFDCLPIRQYYKKNKTLYEKLVTFNKTNNSFVLKDMEILDKKHISEIQKYEFKNTLEISNLRERYFKKICKYLAKTGGLVIIFDYGYIDKPNHFTLQSLFNNKASNVIDNPGKQDITSLVDFNSLIKLSKNYDLHVDIFCNQREFLLSNGINERANKIIDKSTALQKNIIKSGHMRLIDEGNMGSLFKVLVISKI